MSLQEALLAIIGVVVTLTCGAAVPFSVSVTSRLSRIEALIETFNKRVDRIENSREKYSD